jgi:hypothetical protein
MTIMNVSQADANSFLRNLNGLPDGGTDAWVDASELFPDPVGVPPGLYQYSIARLLEHQRHVEANVLDFEQGRALVRMTPQGVMRANELEDADRPASVVQKLTSETSQRMINLGNLLVALLALLVAAIALLRSG